MGMSDCEKCWDDPCTCGHGYRDWNITDLKEQISMLRRVLKQKQKERKQNESQSKRSRK